MDNIQWMKKKTRVYTPLKENDKSAQWFHYQLSVYEFYEQTIQLPCFVIEKMGAALPKKWVNLN